MKSMYSFIAKTWHNKEQMRQLMWERLQKWRREPVIVRVERPTKLHRARALGYKAKKGIIVVRIRVRRGGRLPRRPSRGR
ncbi:MAG: 50S ribosomal protein L15e, partial [Archaeoglobaceae archaeon]|nr:50S ribosomal protein L15e [Archaeoglobaceae archaeon]